PLCLAALAPEAPGGSAPVPAVVTAATENLYARPDETGPVDSQAILGEPLQALETTAGFARVRTADGNTAWIPERSIRRGAPTPPPTGRVARVTSNFAHVYASPSFTAARPLLTAPVGSRMGFLEREERAGFSWMRVSLPDGRVGFVAQPDVALLPFDETPPLRSPSSWIAFGRRFLGAPYTWGGTTPAGFDCSGLMQRIFSEHGVTLKRNSYEQAFRDPRLVPVAFEALEPGDLLFFGTENRIDHEAMWIGDGTVLQSTRHNVPGVQITPFDSPFLKPLFRYARRLKSSSNEKRGPELSEAKVRDLTRALDAIADGSGARFGIVFKDLGSGLSLSKNPSVPMHAASTMKTAVMLEVLRRVDEGSLKLSDELPVNNEFRSLVDGSLFSIAPDGLDPEDEGPTLELLGKSATLEFLVREMIVRSSNLATNIVVSKVGPGAVQKFTDELGAPTVKVRRCVEDSKAYEKGLNNETDAAGMAALMEAAVRTPKLSAAARAKAWEILTGQMHNDQIPAGLHPQSGAVVGHKTGETSSVQHDAAVVRLPDGREYVLVILANDFGASDEGRQRVLEASRRMSRAVWEAMIAP
ncbi:MAG TPA: serine hydrolase, partial [Thermoanaerobaculia bacterium]|nr:serine hydrolase [Thermoanaerobaculia bacterium]